MATGSHSGVREDWPFSKLGSTGKVVWIFLPGDSWEKISTQKLHQIAGTLRSSPSLCSSRGMRNPLSPVCLGLCVYESARRVVVLLWRCSNCCVIALVIYLIGVISPRYISTFWEPSANITSVMTLPGLTPAPPPPSLCACLLSLLSQRTGMQEWRVPH